MYFCLESVYQLHHLGVISQKLLQPLLYSGINVKAESNTVGLFLQLGDLHAAHLKAVQTAPLSVHLLNREAWKEVNCTVLKLATFQRQVLDINSPKLEVKCAGRNPSEAGSCCPSKRWGVTCDIIGDILCWFGAQSPALAAFLGCCTSHAALGAFPAVCTGSTVCNSKSALELFPESVSWGPCHKAQWIKGVPEVTLLFFEPSCEYLFPLSWNYSLCVSWMNL